MPAEANIPTAVQFGYGRSGFGGYLGNVDTKAINAHIGEGNLGAAILTALQEAGKDIDALTREDLASFDEHHGGGREATRDLAEPVGLREGMHVLDVGGGIGYFLDDGDLITGGSFSAKRVNFK